MKMKLFQDPQVGREMLEDYDDRHDIRCFGSKSWKPELFAHYSHVADINIASHCREIYDVIEEAFSIHNKYGIDDHYGPDQRIERLGRQHSMSVGDILLFDGVHYIVDSCGFTPVEVFDGSNWYYK